MIKKIKSAGLKKNLTVISALIIIVNIIINSLPLSLVLAQTTSPSSPSPAQSPPASSPTSKPSESPASQPTALPTAAPTSVPKPTASPVPSAVPTSAPPPPSPSPSASPSAPPAPISSGPLPSTTPSPSVNLWPTDTPTALPAIQPNFNDFTPSQNSAVIKQPVEVLPLSQKDYSLTQPVIIKLVNNHNLKTEFSLIHQNGYLVNAFIKEEKINTQTILRLYAQNNFQPGKYLLKISDETGKTSELYFNWGMIAVNTDAPVYQPKDQAQIGLLLFDQEGNRSCNADVDLTFIDQKLSTRNQTVKKNTADCLTRSTSSTADYEATLTLPDKAGTYQLTVTTNTPSEKHSLSQTIEVRDNLPFIIKRTGPAFIVTGDPSPVTLKIKANETFTGTVTDTVPANLSIEKSSLSKSILNFDNIATVSADLNSTKDSPVITTSLRMPFDGSYPISQLYCEN